MTDGSPPRVFVLAETYYQSLSVLAETYDDGIIEENQRDAAVVVTMTGPHEKMTKYWRMEGDIVLVGHFETQGHRDKLLQIMRSRGFNV